MFSSLSQKNKSVLIVVGVLLIIGIIVFIMSFTGNNNNSLVTPNGNVSFQESAQPKAGTTYQTAADQTSTSIIASTTQQVTVKGVSVCLPHKDTSGPTTMECAIGIKTVDGNYYALDTTNGAYQGLPAHVEIVVKGEFTPIEMISSNLGKIYNIKGIIRASSTESVPKK